MKKKVTAIATMDEKKPLKQSNRLIESRYKLTMYEQRLIIAICSQLNENAEEFGKVRIKVSEIANFCNFEPEKAYSLVKKTIKKLASRTLEIKLEDGNWYVTHWLQSAKYINGESIIEYKIDDELKPELLQLKSGFLRAQTKPLMEFRRDYSARLYFLLKRMLKIKDFDYSLDFFRDRFQLSKSYEISANLKNKVIDPAVKEINEKSDINVKHEYIKEGRTYTKIHFTITLKKEPNKEEQQIETETGQLRLNESIYDSDGSVADRLVKRGVTPQKAKSMAKKYNEKQINENINYALKFKDSKENLAGFIISCIENNIVENNRKAKEEIDKKEKEQLADDRQAKEFFYGKTEDFSGDYEKPVIMKDGKIISM